MQWTLQLILFSTCYNTVTLWTAFRSQFMNTKFRMGNVCAKIDTLNGFHENVLGVFSLVGTSWICMDTMLHCLSGLSTNCKVTLRLVLFVVAHTSMRACCCPNVYALCHQSRIKRTMIHYSAKIYDKMFATPPHGWKAHLNTCHRSQEA